MKYVFFGSPRFARIVLEQMLPDMAPAAAVVNPDRPAGRKKTLTPPPVKLLLQERAPQTELLQPERPKEVIESLREIGADVFVVAAYAKIIPQSVLDIPRLGTIGVHPSLLPKHRGASPLQEAILSGETASGTTLYLMDKDVDHGPILAQEEAPIGGMDYLELEAALATLGGKMLRAVLPQVLQEKIKPRIQDESEATFTKKFETADGFIEPEVLQRALEGSDPEAAAVIWRTIRALGVEPGVWTEKDGRRTKLLQAELSDGKLVLQKIHRAGKTPEVIARGSWRP